MKKLALTLSLILLVSLSTAAVNSNKLLVSENDDAGHCWSHYTITTYNPYTGQTTSNTYTDYLGIYQTASSCSSAASLHRKTILGMLNSQN